MAQSRKFIARNLAARVQIEYDVELYGAEKKIQLAEASLCADGCSSPARVLRSSVPLVQRFLRARRLPERAMDATAVLLQKLLLYGVLPLWMLAGFSDWLCHRIQHIEQTAGIKESMLHWAMLAELGVAIAAALLLQINAAVLALLVAMAVAHELTTWWDLSYAASRRRIAVPEQWVHGLQVVLPWAALVLLIVIHRDQALAAVGLGSAQADWRWHWKDPPLPVGTLGTIAVATALLVLLPFGEEFRRCRKAGYCVNNGPDSQ